MIKDSISLRLFYVVLWILALLIPVYVSINAKILIVFIVFLILFACFQNFGPIKLTALLLLWIALQNFLLPLLYSWFRISPTIIKILLISKELFLLLLISYLLLLISKKDYSFRLNVLDYLFICFTIIVSIYLIFPLSNNSSFINKITSFRTLIFPMLFYLLGRLLIINYKNNIIPVFIYFSRYIIVIGFVIAVFGIFERIFLTDEFWRDLNLGLYWIDIKGMPESSVINGLPGNFYGDYGYGYGMGVRRLISTLGDPLAAGYFLFFILILSYSLYSSKEISMYLNPIFGVSFRKIIILVIIFSSIALLLTITRAVIILIPLILILDLLLSKKKTLYMVLWSGVFLITLYMLFNQNNIVFNIIKNTITGNDSSTMGHISALKQSLNVLPMFFGQGLGVSGAMVASQNTQILAGENIYLVMYSQIGFVGVLFFILIIGNIIKKYGNYSIKFGKSNKLFNGILYTMIGYAITGMVSEQILTVTSTSFFWFYLGLLQSSINSLNNLRKARELINEYRN